jgi:putative thioredoxin
MAGIYGQGAGQAEPQGGAGADATALVKDVTMASFGADVITESARQPVLVDFWAPWCEPCKQLGPILEKVVKAAGGKIKLVKMNIDEHPQIAGRLGVRSIPAVIAFQRSQPIDGFVGALPESEVRGFIERLIGPLGEAEDLLAEAEALLAAGDVAAAAELYAAIVKENPNDYGAVAGLAKIFIGAGQIESAKTILASVPAAGARDPAIVAVQAALDLAEQAASIGDFSDLTRRIEADPNDYQARFDFAIALNAQDKREEAAAVLLDIIRRDRTWSDDGARKQLLQFFDAWGPVDPATIGARRNLSALLFS